MEIVKSFNDKRLKELALQLIYVESPEVLGKKRKSNMDKLFSERLIGDTHNDVPWRTIKKAVSELDNLNSSIADDDEEHLTTIKEYLLIKQKEYSLIN